MALLTLNEIYASGGQMPVICLTISNQEIGTLRFILGHEDREISGQTYRAAAFTIQLPERSDSGFSDLSFSICGVNGECYRYIRQALASGVPTYLTLTQYHPVSMAAVYQLTLTVIGGQITRERADFTASFCDMLNTEFPKLRYTAYNAPGLKYVA
ncbi:MAG: DUF1833 family protein [Succinimonas sp.]|nr:DUF1833 family protein [Succinimonas sp.]